MKKLVKKLIISTLAISLLGCNSNNKPEEENVEKELFKYQNTALDAGFDTLYSYTEYGYDEDLLKKHFDMGTELFTTYNNLFDIYNDYEGINNLKTINDNAGIKPVEVDEKIIEMLKEAKEFYELSDGAFDITIGALLKVWHNYRDEGIALNEKGELAPLPTLEELEAVSACRGFDKVEIDEEKNTVYINDPCVSLDVGGIAKGYAAERIYDAIVDEDTLYGTINAGRNIRAFNTKPDAPWKIGVADPEGANSALIIESDTENSFVTSGDYERFFVGDDGETYPHIVDPDTLYPAKYYRSVTIVTLDSGAADALSTALFAMSVEDGKALLKKYEEVSGNKASAVWIMDKDKRQDAHGKELENYFVAYTEDLEDKITW